MINDDDDVHNDDDNEENIHFPNPSIRWLLLVLLWTLNPPSFPPSSSEKGELNENQDDEHGKRLEMTITNGDEIQGRRFNKNDLMKNFKKLLFISGDDDIRNVDDGSMGHGCMALWKRRYTTCWSSELFFHWSRFYVDNDNKRDLNGFNDRL